MNDRGIKSSYLLSLLSKITNLENTSQFKVVKDSTSKRGNDLKKKQDNTGYFTRQFVNIS